MKLDSVKTALTEFTMFEGSSASDKLGLAVGLAKTFTKDGSTNFIGKNPPPNKDDNWMFSVKFSGCRLNDMFDMVPKDVYQKSYSSSDERDAGRKSMMIQKL